MSDTNVSNASSAIKAIPLTFKEKMFAGAIARGVSQTMLHPVDVLRTRIQARDVAVSWKPSVFIKGVIPQITLAVPAGAIQFVAFETAKEKLTKWFPDEKFAQARALVAGAFGATMAASCRVPQEVLKQRIQADIYPNIIVAIRETVFKQGIGSLYKGALATISRDVPWNALSFMFHSQGKAIFKSVKGRAPANDENLVLAGIAGAIAAIIMTPVDVVKTRIMTAKAGTVSAGIIPTLQRIVVEEGPQTLMKGVIPRIMFLAPLAGITFSVYEAVAEKIRQSKMPSATSSAAVRGHPYQHLGRAALRFGKSPVRLARGDEFRGQFLGDYRPTTVARFSLNLC